MEVKANPVPESRPFASDSPRHWIVKFAPLRTSWREIVRDGNFTLRGVRSLQAQRNLSEMSLGDLAFFYHSQQEQAIVGLMVVTRTAYPDPTTSDSRWLTCDFRPVRTLSQSVPLSAIRAHAHLCGIALVRQPRLSVAAIDPQDFSEILRLAAN